MRKQRRIRGKKRTRKKEIDALLNTILRKNQIQILRVCGCQFFPLSSLFFSLSMLVCTEAVRRLIGCQPAKDHQQLGRKERETLETVDKWKLQGLVIEDGGLEIGGK